VLIVVLILTAEVPRENFGLEKSQRTVKEKIGDAPQLLKFVAKRRRQCSLLRC